MKPPLGMFQIRRQKQKPKTKIGKYKNGNFHLETKPIKRSEEEPSVAASAYRAGVSLVDNRTGVKHSYEKKWKKWRS